MSAMVTTNGAGPTLVKAGERMDLSITFTEEQEQIILDTCCNGATKEEARALMVIAAARGLNPILQECYFVKRYDRAAKKEKWSVQAAIDSLRIKAEQTGIYAGQDEPEYEYDNQGFVTLARVRVWRKDWPRPAVGVARWDEYVQTTREGDPTHFWKQMPHNQLAKCAEALALRKAFPTVLSKIYTVDEMGQAENVLPYTPERARPQISTVQPKALSAPKENGWFAKLCEQLDAAETLVRVNAMASAVAKAHKEGHITDEQLERLKVSVTTKRSLVKEASREPGEEG